MILIADGDERRALTSLDRAIAIFQDGREALGMADSLKLKALALLSVGQITNGEIEATFDAALQIYRRIGHRPGELDCLRGLAEVAARRDTL